MHTGENILIYTLKSMYKLSTHLGEIYYACYSELYYLFYYGEDQFILSKGIINQRYAHNSDFT